MIRDPDIDMAALHGRTVAIIGFGNQGRAQALNLRESGIAVRIGLRAGSSSEAEVRAAGLDVLTLRQAAGGADVVMLLAPDERLAAIHDEIAPALKPGAALGFSHGLAIHFGLIHPRADLDVFMIAPKGPGTALRSLYEQGRGMVALAAVAQDATGQAWPLALAYAKALGCGRAGLIRSTFEEECVADLFNEGAVVWGAVPQILQAGFETLVQAGIQPEIAYLECVSELKLLAELIEARGISGTAEAISNTAEFGALRGGPRVIDPRVRAAMADVLEEVRSGNFVEALSAEADGDYPELRGSRQRARGSVIEAVRRRLAGSSDPA